MTQYHYTLLIHYSFTQCLHVISFCYSHNMLCPSPINQFCHCDPRCHACLFFSFLSHVLFLPHISQWNYKILASLFSSSSWSLSSYLLSCLILFFWISPLGMSHYLSPDMFLLITSTSLCITDTNHNDNQTYIRETWCSLVIDMLMHPPPVTLPHQNNYIHSLHHYREPSHAQHSSNRW